MLRAPGKDEPDLRKYRVTNGSIPALPKEGPCYMASLQGIAETYAGKNMTAAQKTESARALVESDVMDSAFTVNDSKAVIVDALTRLGVDTSKLDIRIILPGDPGYDDAKGTATDSLRHVGRRDGTGGAVHWQQGGSKGVFVWDPISGTDEGGREYYDEDTRYVIITKKDEE